MKKLVGQKQIGLYIKGFNLFANVYEPGLRKAVKQANIDRIMHGFVGCEHILASNISPENFYCNFEVWNTLSNYITTQAITIEEAELTLANEKRKILVVRFGKYESEDDYFYKEVEEQ
jgi:hypothetical protein